MDQLRERRVERLAAELEQALPAAWHDGLDVAEVVGTEAEADEWQDAARRAADRLGRIVATGATSDDGGRIGCWASPGS